MNNGEYVARGSWVVGRRRAARWDGPYERLAGRPLGGPYYASGFFQLRYIQGKVNVLKLVVMLVKIL